MSHFFFYLQILILLPAHTLAQKKWDAGAGDGLWSSPLNWSDDLLPAQDDAIVLDNSFVRDSYSVRLPDGTLSVTVKSISIVPLPGNNIELVLPVENTIVPALIITGPGYGLDIGNGGIFRNASGASSGTPVSISDSIRIRNGGRYIHNTERAHAANVQALSAAPGTEEGIMEFDVPDRSSTISLSGRTFGKLVLKAAAVAGGTLKYTAAGTSGVHIRSDLEIDAGVSCGLNFSDTITVDGNFINAGTLDLGNTARSVVLAIKKDITQTATGLMTETGTGSQDIFVSGRTPQKINIGGGISNEVGLTVSSSSLVTLTAPLSLDYRISLEKGIVNTSSSAMLTLGPACLINVDTLSSRSFINGPLRRSGAGGSNLVFPVGKGTAMRWMELTGTTGDFTVEYYKEDPYRLSSSTGNGLHHISHMEYWSISGSGSTSGVKLSFADPQSGGVTDLSHLRVAELVNTTWENGGSAATGGSAGRDGWVTSVAGGGLSAANNYFALASATGQENPLPVSRILLKANRLANTVQFSWNALPDRDLLTFELQRSAGREPFTTVWTQKSDPHVSDYSHTYYLSHDNAAFFRVRTEDEKGYNHYSNAVSVGSFFENNYCISGGMPSGPTLTVTITTPAGGLMDLTMYNSLGVLVKHLKINALKGSAAFSIDISSLSAGVFYLYGSMAAGKTNVFRFIR